MSFCKGDCAFIGSNVETFISYGSFVEAHAPEYMNEWARNEAPAVGASIMVLAVAPHKYLDDIPLAAVQDSSGKVYVVKKSCLVPMYVTADSFYKGVGIDV